MCAVVSLTYSRDNLITHRCVFMSCIYMLFKGFVFKIFVKRFFLLLDSIFNDEYVYMPMYGYVLLAFTETVL